MTERHLGRFLGAADTAAVALCVLAFAAPWLTGNLFAFSVVNQILIATIAAYSVFVMLRMNLLTFAVPAFMAIGGFAAALVAKAGGTNVVLLGAVSFLVPALVALPLGVLVLRLRGVYFVLVTFIFSEILRLFLFETPTLTGGSNGIAGIPAATFFAVSFSSSTAVLQVAAGIALVATVITAALCRRCEQPFAAIDENETLAASLGLVIWRYKALGFVIAGGLAGLAGLALVLMLLTAHPSSFSPLSSVNYITYAIVGGRASILGPVIGSAVLVFASNLFSSQGEYSQGFFGLLIILAILVARGGIIGALQALLPRRTRRAAGVAGSAAKLPDVA
jgi:branched-chain amino acid transport system permease protein